jgi:hypothetical protein
LAIQFLIMCWWSEELFSRFSLTTDAAQYLQQFFLISHGHINAIGTIQPHAAIRDHFSLAIWPLSIFDWIPPHGLWLFWLQDLGLVVAEAVAFSWIRRIVASSAPRIGPRTLAALPWVGLAILVLNPWTYWSMSFDLHMEPFACPFIVGAAYDFSRQRNRRAWIWVGVVLLFGDATTTWIVGLAISAALAAWFSRGRHYLRTAILLAGAGIVWLELIGLLGANESSILPGLYGYLVTPAGAPPPAHLSVGEILRGMVMHPGRALSTLWAGRVNLLANTAPAGVVGVATPWTLGVPLVILVPNALAAFSAGLFSAPGFQSCPVYIFGAVGVIIVALQVAARIPLRSLALLRGAVVLLVVNAGLWAVVWIPAVDAAWLRVSPAQARSLAKVANQIPINDQVVASQGVIGRFASRAHVVSLQQGGRIPVRGRTVWFVFDPNSGIESESVNNTLGFMAQLAGPLHAQLMDHSQGMWAFRWRRPSGTHVLHLKTGLATIPAWAVVGPSGSAVDSGPVSQWHVNAQGTEGYVLDQDYQNVPVGHYEARVTLADHSALTVEVWDTNQNVLIARSELPAERARETYVIPVVATSDEHVAPYSGWGPFGFDPPVNLDRQVLEVRVWSPAGGFGRIDTVDFQPES